MATGVKKRGNVWDAWLKSNGKVSWGRSFRTQAEAIEWRNERVRMREQHVELLAARITVEELVRRHLELYAVGLKPATRAKYLDLLERYVVTDPIGRRPARDVRPSDVQAFVNRVVASSSPAMASKAYGLLRMAYRKAVDNEELSKSPVRGLILPKRTVPLDVPHLRETEQLLRAVSEDYRDAVELVSLTGLRRGEVVALRWSAVKLELGELAIMATAGWISTELVRDGLDEVLLTSASGAKSLVAADPKTDAGSRVVVLLPRAIELLRQVREKQLAHARELGEAYDGTGGFVFTRPDGRPLDPNELSRSVTSASRSLGRRFRLHDVRHAYVTRAVEAGIPAAIIAATVGHSDPSFTQRRYFHANGEQQRAAAERLEAYLSGARVTNGLQATHEADESGDTRRGIVEVLPRS